jgi:hypothetical protein
MESSGGHRNHVSVGGRTSGPFADDLLRRSFVRHIATLVATGRCGHDLALALARGVHADDRLVVDVAAVIRLDLGRPKEPCDPVFPLALRGELTILRALVGEACPALRRELRELADRAERVLASLGDPAL